MTSLTLGACSSQPSGGAASLSALLGSGKFTLRLEGRKDIPVYYVTGARATRDATILVVMHGTDRNGADYRNTWAGLVRDRDVVVVVPQFSREDFPGAENYNLGGLADPDGRDRRNPGVEDGAYGYIEPLFERTRERIGGSQEGFVMFGHSAGAQFVHRYVELVPDAPVSTAVAANAGWYTMPDDSERFPYGLKGDHAPAFDARAAFGRRLIVLLGEEDTETENLRQDDGAMAQGDTRLARGKEFFARARAVAQRDDVPFRWVLAEVPGVAHDQVGMAGAAVPYLLGAGEGR